MKAFVGNALGRSAGAFAALFCAVALALALPSLALADAPGADQRALTVKQAVSASGQVPASLSESFGYELAAASVDAALPAGASDGVYSFKLDGDGAERSFYVGGTGEGALDFLHAGVYSYTLKCTESPAVEGMEVDASEYAVRISVENAPDGLRLGWVEIRDSSGAKPHSIEYRHAFKGKDPVVDDGFDQGGPTIFGIHLPRTGDALWGLVAVCGGLMAFCAALLVALARRKARDKSGSDR